MPAKRNVAIVLAALLVLALGLAAGAAGAMQASPTAVAVVDLKQVVESLKEQQSVRADLMSRQEDLNRQAEQKSKAISGLQSDLDLLAAGTPAHQQKQAELEKAALEFRLWREFETLRLRREEQLQVENLLRKTQDAIGQVAQDNGYDVVIFKEQSANFRSEGQQGQLNIRVVAWNHERVELTDQVIQRMNNEFEAGR